MGPEPRVPKEVSKSKKLSLKSEEEELRRVDESSRLVWLEEFEDGLSRCCGSGGCCSAHCCIVFYGPETRVDDKLRDFLKKDLLVKLNRMGWGGGFLCQLRNLGTRHAPAG